MTLLNLIKAPLHCHKDDLSDKVKIKKFGLSLSILMISIWGLGLPWFFSTHYPYWPWVTAAFLSLASLINALWITPIYIFFVYISHILGTINISILLGIVFYFIMVPIGFALKWLGNDPMSRKLETGRSSYRIVRNDSPKDRFERPF